MIELKEEFVALVRDMLGCEEGAALVAALDSEPVTGVRFNPRKFGAPGDDVSGSGTARFADGLFADGRRVDWCREGLVLGTRPQFTLMPEWHGGLFYVQEPSSMVIGEVVRRLASRLGHEGLRYLDMCAAPGGKTTAALGALPDDAFVVANEFVPSRANILCENLAKWGSPNSAVCCGDTSAFRKMRECFDIVAVDAPCSGEGMMRKDEEARRQWNEGLVRQCAALQREIVNNAWEALRPGGYLIYSTCTFNRTEDEEMLHYIADELGGESMDTGVVSDFSVPGSLNPDLHAMRFMPHRTCGEGLFMGVMRKPGETGISIPKKNKGKGKKSVAQTMPKELPGLIAEPEKYVFGTCRDGDWRAITKEHTDLVETLERNAKVLNAGIRLGTLKGKSFVPDAALALSSALAPGAFPRMEIDLETALAYLRREAITLPAGTPLGVVLITYSGIALGFAKNLGNRANNMYPQHWRIRHL